MKSLKILFIAFFLLCALQNNAQKLYKPIDSVPAIKYEMDTATVNFTAQNHFKNTITGQPVNVIHSLKNTGFQFYNSVSFSSKTAGVIAGGTGLRIRATTDGGLHWKSFSFSRFANAFYSTTIHKDQFFVVGASRYIFRSRDQGKNWEVFDVSTLAKNKYGLRYPKFYKIKFSKSGFGLLMGESSGKPIFLKTNDDGKSWQLIHPNGLQPNERLVSDAVILPDKTVRVVTSRGNVYQSEDDLEHWTLLRSGKKNESLNSITFKNKKEGYVSGLQGLLLKTIDGGKTWQKINTEDALSYNANISNLGYISKNKVLLTTAKSFQNRKFDTFVFTLDQQENIKPFILKKDKKDGFIGDAYGMCILKNTLFLLDRDNLYETSLQQK